MIMKGAGGTVPVREIREMGPAALQPNKGCGRKTGRLHQPGKLREGLKVELTEGRG
jgi:hypothetical protein